MERSLFSKVAKLAHKLTKEYKAKFPDVDYRTQQGIFFKLVYSLMKKKVEKAVDNRMKNKDGIKQVTTYIKGKGLDISYYVTGRGMPPTNDITKWKSIWTLNVFNICKLLY